MTNRMSFSEARVAMARVVQLKVSQEAMYLSTGLLNPSLLSEVDSLLEALRASGFPTDYTRYNTPDDV